MITKQSLRKQVAEGRGTLSPDLRALKSREIAKNLFSLSEFQAAKTVLFFASFRTEVETAPMIREALAKGKRVVLPKVAGKNLALFEICDFDADTERGAWDIPEPRETRPVSLSEIDFLIIPGLAFDQSGGRLGYGAGFYDKLLKDYEGPGAAIAFEIQIVPSVPVDQHDVPMKLIITEKRIIKPNSK